MILLGQEVPQQPTQSPTRGEVDTGELHHFPDPAAIWFCVAVNGALLALRLRIKGTIRQSLLRVGEQIGAVGTHLARLGAMILVAVHADKCGEYSLLLFVRCHYQ